MKYKLFFYVCLLSILYSCTTPENIEIDTIKTENTSRSVKNAIFNAIEHAMQNSKGIPNFVDCEEPDFNNCFVLDSIWLEDWMDISHCSQGLSDSCLLVGYMVINICWDHQNDVLLVDFDEHVVGHGIDLGVCVIDPIHFDVQHAADWICEFDVFYDFYIDHMMQIVVDYFSDDNIMCGSGITKVRSRYQKDLCVAICKFEDKAGVQFKTLPCGENTVCCVLNEEWCVEEDGSIVSNVINYNRIGEGCSNIGNWPCRQNPGTSCFTRDCPNE